VHNSPVTDTVLDDESPLSLGAVEMWTRLILAHLTTTPSYTVHHNITLQIYYAVSLLFQASSSKLGLGYGVDVTLIY